MSTNLSPEAKAAREKYLDANTIEDKIQTLERYISLIPKHKATEKMVAQLKSRLVKYRKELEEKKRRQKALAKGPVWVIPKEGDAQVCLVGVSNSGKSQLLNILTGASSKVGEYAFSTTKPEPGVLDCDGAIIQLIDTPSIFENIRESKNGPMLLSQIRAADLVVFVIDLTKNIEDQLTLLLNELHEGGIRINQQRPSLELKKTGSGGALLAGEEKVEASKDEILEILHNQGYYNFSLKIQEPMTLLDLVEALDEGIMYLEGIIVANKGDCQGSKERFKELKEKFGNTFSIYPVSAAKEIGLMELKEAIFDHLDLIRVKSKEPNGEIAKKPIVLKKGATVADVAKIIHSRFYDHFRIAKVTGPSAKFDDQSVGLNHELEDGDIVEIFAD